MLRKLITVALTALALFGVQVAALASDTGTADESFAVVKDNEGPSSANPCST